jgi:hypothetical protein
MSSLNFFCRANKRGRVYYFCENNVQQQKINKLSASGVNGVPNELNEGESFGIKVDFVKLGDWERRQVCQATAGG